MMSMTKLRSRTTNSIRKSVAMQRNGVSLGKSERKVSVVGSIEPLSEAFIQEILTGEKPKTPTAVDSNEEKGSDMNLTDTTGDETSTAINLYETVRPEVASIGGKVDEFAQFDSSVQPGFITIMQKNLSTKDVCRIMDVPVSSMRIFATALNPDFLWEDLGKTFKETVLGLLHNRSNRMESRSFQNCSSWREMWSCRLKMGSNFLRIRKTTENIFKKEALYFKLRSDSRSVPAVQALIPPV
jgi:hypothetical protein